MSSHSTRSGNKTKIGVAFCVHDDHWFLEAAIASFRSAGDVFVFLSEVPWNGEPGDWERVRTVAEKAGATVISGGWPAEILHRQCAVQSLIDRGFTHCLMPDTDEIPEPSLLKALVDIAGCRLAERVYVHMDTYWKHPDCVIRPRERLTPLLMFELAKVHPIDVHMFNGRLYDGGRGPILPPEYGVLHHLSYVGPDERIQRKISTWSHSHEVLSQWWNSVWLAWDQDRLMRNLHPTHPPVYGSVERIRRPDALADVPDYRVEPGAENPFEQVPARWPKVSIVIPLHGGPKDIADCLGSLAKLQDLVHETIVVDDASPDDAASVASGFYFVKLLRNEENLGFAKTCNKGFEASTGSVLLFLNSDTIVPRAGLIRLVESLMESGSIGAAGPLSNNVGYYQKIEPTYTSDENLDLFAEDLALSERDDRDVEMLVGFALAVKRSVLEEVGPFDERFGRGMFEDTDFCYRMARAGYRLRLANRAYIHHLGSRTLARTEPNVNALLNHNGELYKAKWRRDLETGYASHLPGFNVTQGLVVFNPDRHPDKLARELARLRDRANISLCMIVRNEERVLGACLESAKPFFKEMIVVDTGSADRTIEIAREHGARVYEMVWPDSFAEARNESMKHATGEWIFWMDADDTLPWSSGMTIVQAAINAPKEVAGFIVAVQFVEEGPASGTRVAHVKLFRNKKGLRWEGRIHENILANLRRFGELAWTDAYVLHSGYDTSVEGQQRKRERDWPLLWLDHQDRPKHPFPMFNIGMTYHFTNGHEEAVEWMKKSIAHSGPKDSHLAKAWSMMGLSLQILGRLDEAEAAFREGISKVGEDPELSFRLAGALTAQGRPQEAKAIYEAMPTATKGLYSLDIGILTFKRLQNLASVKHALDDYKGAKEAWLEAFKINPRSLVSLLALFDAALSKGDIHTARDVCDTFVQSEGPTVEWAELRARLAEESEAGSALAALDRMTQELPQAIGPRLMLARTLLQRQHMDAAIHQLRILDQQNVAEAAFFLGIAHLQAGDAEAALRYTERAVELNPGHQPSREQRDKLRALLPAPMESGLSADERRALLTGPHAGMMGSGSKRFSIVIVTYNSEAFIEPCLGSVLPTLGGEDEVVVVDNASSDQTLARVRSFRDKRIKVVRSGENLGYSKAANIGALKSKGQVVVLLNPDTEVFDGWLRQMAMRLDEGIGAVGPLSDVVAGQQFIGHYLPPDATLRVDKLASFASRELGGRTVETKFLVGMCLMLPRSILDQCGLLDENMVLGADDLDLSWRLAAHGFRLRIAMDAFVRHAGQASFATRPREETSALVALSDAALVSKLKRFYGQSVPTSMQLWGCPIFDEAFSRGQ